MADVFISYSRKDKDFVRQLHDALAKLNREAWVDWQDIPLTAESLEEIYAGIDSADNFLFVISPESIASIACHKEIAHASESNKRLIPLLHREVPDADIPETLAQINFASAKQMISTPLLRPWSTRSIPTWIGRGYTRGCWCARRSGSRRDATRAFY